MTVKAELFADRASNQPLFLLGANYEGPTPHAWRMWEDQRFDPLLIAADFDRARSAGLATLRIFVQSRSPTTSSPTAGPSSTAS